MPELEPLAIEDIPAIRRLKINDLMFHSPLSNDVAEPLDEAVDKVHDLAEEAYDVIEDIRGISDSVTNDLSLPQYKEIEGYLDALCDVRDAVAKEQSTINDGYNHFCTLIEDQDGSAPEGKTEDVRSAVEDAVDDAEALYDAINLNIQSVANYIDQ